MTVSFPRRLEHASALEKGEFQILGALKIPAGKGAIVDILNTVEKATGNTYNGLTLFGRSSRGAALAKEAVQIVRDMDRNLPLIEVRMLTDAFAQSLARGRYFCFVSIS